MPRFGRRLLVRVTQASFTISVAAIIANENNEILLLDHVLRTTSGWGIPGGFINKGEQPEQALRREIYEETSLELKNLKLIRVRTIGQHVEILFTAAAVGTAQVKSREINSLLWFGVDDLPEKMSKNQKSLIRDFLSSRSR